LEDDENGPLLSEQENASKRPKTTDVEGMEVGGDFFVSSQYGGGGRNRVAAVVQKPKPAFLSEQEMKEIAHSRKKTGVLAVVGIPSMRRDVDNNDNVIKEENEDDDDIENNNNNNAMLQPNVKMQENNNNYINQDIDKLIMNDNNNINNNQIQQPSISSPQQLQAPPLVVNETSEEDESSSSEDKNKEKNKDKQKVKNERQQ